MYQIKVLKYPANHFIEKDKETLKSLTEVFPLATLITSHQDEIFTTYLPLLWEGSDYLIGHLDANNTQVPFLQEGEKVHLIFNGPEAYISPAHFPTNELPTYNYCKIEVKGSIEPISDEALKKGIIQLTTHLEGNEAAYQLTRDENRLHSLVKYIYGFKIKVNSMQGRFKMSQDKSVSHQKKAIDLMQNSLKNRNQDFLENYWNGK